MVGAASRLTTPVFVYVLPSSHHMPGGKSCQQGAKADAGRRLLITIRPDTSGAAPHNLDQPRNVSMSAGKEGGFPRPCTQRQQTKVRETVRCILCIKQQHLSYQVRASISQTPIYFASSTRHVHASLTFGVCKVFEILKGYDVRILPLSKNRLGLGQISKFEFTSTFDGSYRYLISRELGGSCAEPVMNSALSFERRHLETNKDISSNSFQNKRVIFSSFNIEFTTQSPTVCCVYTNAGSHIGAWGDESGKWVLESFIQKF